MSTKHIRAVIETALATSKRHSLVPEAQWILTTALREVEAIETAAKGLVEIWGHAGDGNPAEVLIRAIAKEAP